MLWGNYDFFNIQGTKTILEGLRSNPRLIVYFTEGRNQMNTTMVWIDLGETITTVSHCQRVTCLTGSNLSCAALLTTVISRPRWPGGEESSLKRRRFPYSNYSVRFVRNYIGRQREVLELNYSSRFELSLTFGSLLHFESRTSDSDYTVRESWRRGRRNGIENFCRVRLTVIARMIAWMALRHPVLSFLRLYLLIL
jgi:hypothetical protein